MWRYLNYLLYPFSLLYGLVLWIRNRLYDNGMLTAVEFDLPVIAVGNLSVGGTGKTPHVEYLIRLLKAAYRVATLSRGYNRRTRGFLLAKADSTSADIGDEPMQFHQKFPDITVCVGEERMLAVPQLLGDRPETQVILLDDAFQHRSIKPGLNLMVTDYSRLFTRDHVVPFGRLREGRNGYYRADGIIVSKCPPELSTQEQEAIYREIAPYPHQRLFFTCLQYGQPYGMLQPDMAPPPPGASILVVCGIARPEPLVHHLLQHYANVHLLSFPDHYYYTQQDLDKIKMELDHMDGGAKHIITTEKDAVRLHLLKDSIAAMQLPIAVMPVEVRFLFDGADSFNSYIFDYVADAMLAAENE
ncbi:tetraacyldisaccharide 4'-kinase [Chitinophaga sp. XS-30]|uniref:tetraacyldisaccharide 4'-kinase n=1 Tax=Chitinophaga sp. XS-30 TaxID=2604421 RepID=UPI0011DCD3B4|nr:tetraacyldisaccharide 4'-kinase [Chitinophaga sp. XS-30]QEH42621.1 tetraacyldisaccharide 4'-kinase [Chitinophaga sp. XS-30]